MSLASLFSPVDTTLIYMVIPDQPPSAQYWFGTNSRGQDLFWQMSTAMRNSLTFGLIVATLSRVISLAVGLASGYIGGWVDRVLMFMVGLALGKALMFHCLHRNVAPAYGFQGSMAISNSAPHEFDVARWMLDADYKSISVFRPGGANAPSSAPVFMVLETTGGHLVDIEVNIAAAYGYDVRGELVGEKGSAFLRAPALADVNLGLKGYSVYPEDWRPRFTEAYRRQNLAWVKSLASGVPEGANAWDGYCSTLVAEAGVEALRTGQTVAVEHVSRPSFYA